MTMGANVLCWLFTTHVKGAPGLSLAEVKALSMDYGLKLSLATPMGLGFKAELTDTSRNSKVADTFGFLQPTGVIHWDSIQMRRYTGYFARRSPQNRGQSPWMAANFGVYSVSLLLAAGVLAWAHESAPISCHTVEILAILDDPKQHKTLVRLYRMFGFKTVQEVGGDLSTLPIQLLYGGCGTLMRVSTEQARERCEKLLRRGDGR